MTSRRQRVASGVPAAGRSGPPESRPQLEELYSGERVTEPGRSGAPTTTGPAAVPALELGHSTS